MTTHRGGETSATTMWPKVRAELTPQQVEILNDWYTEYLGHVLPSKFGWIDRTSHRYPLRGGATGLRTLELGPGNGSHIEYENLADQEEYVALELRPLLASQIGHTHGNLRVIVGDCEKHIDFPDNSFDRVIAIHVLEHLANLPSALDEVARVMKPTGRFFVVIPCEGGRIYSLGRRLTTQRVFERRYDSSYDWIIRHEHVNTAREVVEEIRARFRIVHRHFYPTAVPAVDLNVLIGITLALPAGG